ncbi:MAG: hypothetical protein DMG97_10185 [Acidobacteria bacterium]|nr:MAG: hypothetical protein DMG96_27365 [Acidobacteriota bacterium]PYV73872.1 MAG: hypothetical protein DMG97_10185 [Acidobacteriota bacterium]
MEHVRHGRRLSSLPASVDFNTMPLLYALVSAFGVVFALVQVASCASAQRRGRILKELNPQWQRLHKAARGK